MIYDMDGALKNFQKDQRRKKDIEVEEDPDMINVSGVELSVDESNNTEIENPQVRFNKEKKEVEQLKESQVSHPATSSNKKHQEEEEEDRR